MAPFVLVGELVKRLLHVHQCFVVLLLPSRSALQVRRREAIRQNLGSSPDVGVALIPTTSTKLHLSLDVFHRISMIDPFLCIFFKLLPI